MSTPKQKLIEKIINHATLDARRNGYTGIDGTLRRKLNRETYKNLLAVWEKIEKEKNVAQA
jgi:hypothetical protein